MKQAHTSTCYNRGCAGHRVAIVRDRIAVLATSSYVADPVLSLLQEDDRIARIVADLAAASVRWSAPSSSKKNQVRNRGVRDSVISVLTAMSSHSVSNIL